MNQAVVNDSRVTVVAARGCAHTAFTVSHFSLGKVSVSTTMQLPGFCSGTPQKSKRNQKLSLL